MKLRLPNKLVAAIMAAASPVLLQTLSTATLGAAAVAVAGNTAFATDITLHVYTSATEGGVVGTPEDPFDLEFVANTGNPRIITLENGTAITNGGANMTSDWIQISSLTLLGGSESAADINVESGHNYGLLGSGYGKTTLTLNGGTLNKTGAGTFCFTHTDMGEDTGTLNINEGSVIINDNSSVAADAGLKASGLVVNMGNSTTLTVNRDSYIGSLNNGASTVSSTVSVATNKTLNISADSTIAGTLKVSNGNGEIQLAEGVTMSVASLSFINTNNTSKFNLQAGSTLSLSSNYLGEGSITSLTDHITGTGTLELAFDVPASSTSSYTLGKNLDLNGLNLHSTTKNTVHLNGHGYTTGVQYALTLSNGSDAKFDGNLKLESKATVDVAHTDSVLDVAGTLTLGHNSVGNPAYLRMEAGQIKVKNIIRNGDDYDFSTDDKTNTFTMSGGKLTFKSGATGSVISGVKTTISGGTLDTSLTAWEIDNYDADITKTEIGGVIISGANAATLKNFTLTSALTANTNLTLGGTINYTGEAITETDMEHNGFGLSRTYATVVSDASTGRVTNSATWKLKGQSATYNNKVITLDVPDTIYYINTAGHRADFTTGGAADGATAFVLNNNGSINIGRDKTLSSSVITTNGHSATLVGDGVFDLGDIGDASNAHMPAHVTIGDGWTGTVALSSSSTASSEQPLNIANLNAMGNLNSRVQLSGINSWFSRIAYGGTYDVNTNLVLENGESDYALSISGVSANDAYRFNGAVSGSGSWVIANHDNETTYRFNEDLSKWTGSFTTLNDGTDANFNIEFAKADGVVGAAFNGNKNVVKVVENTTFKNRVEGASMVVSNGKTAALANGGTLNIGQTTVEQRHEGQTATLESVTVNANGISKTSGASSATISHANITVGSAPAEANLLALADEVSYTISDVALVDTNIVSHEQLAVSNVSLDAASSISAVAGSSLSGDNHLTLSGAESVEREDTVITSEQMSGLTLQTGSSLTLGMGSHEYAEGVKIGDTFSIKLSGFSWEELVNASDGIYTAESYASTHSGASLNNVFKVLAIGSTDTHQTYYNVLNVETYDSGIVIDVQVPEPATSALGLLALAGLAARRRRK